MARRVRALRKRADLTIEGLASRAGLHPNYVGAVERGEKVPTVRVVRDIARALGVEAATLVDVADQYDAASLRKLVVRKLAALDEDQLRAVVRILDAVKF